jgi:hypothetical protein
MSAGAVITAAFGAIGLALLAIGLTIAISSRRFRSRAGQAEGTIVALRARGSGTGSISAPIVTGPLYHPTVAFTTADGRAVRAESRVGTNPPPGKVGDTVTVFYDQAKPERFTTGKTQRRLGCLAAAFIAFGLVFVGVAAIAAAAALS